jgi:hypothetical protein
MTAKVWNHRIPLLKEYYVRISPMIVDTAYVVLKWQLDLMSQDTKIGIVTAAGYTEAERYYGRLHGLLEAIKASKVLTPVQKQNLVVMGEL